MATLADRERRVFNLAECAEINLYDYITALSDTMDEDSFKSSLGKLACFRAGLYVRRLRVASRGATLERREVLAAECWKIHMVVDVWLNLMFGLTPDGEVDRADGPLAPTAAWVEAWKVVEA